MVWSCENPATVVSFCVCCIQARVVGSDDISLVLFPEEVFQSNDQARGQGATGRQPGVSSFKLKLPFQSSSKRRKQKVPRLTQVVPAAVSAKQLDFACVSRELPTPLPPRYRETRWTQSCPHFRPGIPATP